MENLQQLENEYENYIYLAESLTYEHQISSRDALLKKAEFIKEEINDRKMLLCEEYKQKQLV